MASRPKARVEPRIPAGTTSKGPLKSQRSSPLSGASMTVGVGFFALVAILVVLGSVAEGVRDQEVFTLDTVATPWLHALRSPALEAVMQAASFLGSNLVIPPLFAWPMDRRALPISVVSTGSRPA